MQLSVHKNCQVAEKVTLELWAVHYIVHSKTLNCCYLSKQLVILLQSGDCVGQSLLGVKEVLDEELGEAEHLEQVTEDVTSNKKCALNFVS